MCVCIVLLVSPNGNERIKLAIHHDQFLPVLSTTALAAPKAGKVQRPGGHMASLDNKKFVSQY